MQPQPPATGHVAGRTDPGREPTKQVNEDTLGWAWTPLGLAVVVCDGMGGHEAGREASEAALREILTALSAPERDDPWQALARAVDRAGGAVHRLGRPDSAARPGSTVVASLFRDGQALLAHVGDSRAYLYRSGRLTALTRDHSVVRALVDQGVLSEEAARVHPDANQITRALGIHETVEVELTGPVMVSPSDVVVLCTDGLTDMLDDRSLEAALAEHVPRGLEAAADALVHLANLAGGHDNVTVALVAPPAARPTTLPMALPPTVADVSATPPHRAPATTLPALPADLPGMASPPADAPHRDSVLAVAVPSNALRWIALAAFALAALAVLAVVLWWVVTLAIG